MEPAVQNKTDNKPVDDDQLDDKVAEQKTVKTLTAKEIKKIRKPEFQKTPEKYWPTKVFSKYGFTRTVCKCGNFYWRRVEERTTCGDSNCVGKYTFIGKGAGIGAKGQRITYAQAWKIYEKAMGSQRVPSHSVARYPVVARWRNDVDYVAAGIFCFQPYCVTGELEPPANPLVQPQFCVRFNDLDNIGLTGRHYSGFVMLGNQVFNYPDNYVYFDEECVEFHLNWLLSMELDLDEVTLIEDVWSGGGNLGSSIEIFMHGLEVGNMVFTRFKYYPDGALEELDIKVIDVGIGLERIPWLINGSPTSYCDIFPQSLAYVQGKLGLDMSPDIWQKLGPYSCLLNIDEVDNIDETWENIARTIGVPVADVRRGIIPVKDLYIILDHTRTVMMVVRDGSLPSNVGGGANIRNVLRRVFAILKKNDWWERLGGMAGFLELFEYQRADLVDLYGEFAPYKSFNEIIEIEYERWLNTDVLQRQKLDKLLKKSKTLTLDDWILAITSFGIPADQIAQISGQTPPGNLYYEIAYRQEKITKAPEVILYKTAHLKETENLYYQNHHLYEFDATIAEIFHNISDGNKRNIVILDKSAFYPQSGGQQNDIGFLTIEGVEYRVKDCEKVGKAVLHILDQELPNEVDFYVGKAARGRIDAERRKILRNHHTATHIVFAACRQVLGPHVWQNGAKKTIENAHLDITHYSSLTKEKELEIENAANRIILSNKRINKSLMDKAQAEKQYGFRLYQGGIVPGNTLRVVNIEDTDVEACCGTHCDSTSEVGWVKIIKTNRISDGILRLYYVAGDRAIERLNQETAIINELTKLWGVNQKQVVDTASKFFERTKHSEKEVEEQRRIILDLRVSVVLKDANLPRAFFRVREDEATLYISNCNAYIAQLKATNKAIIFVGRVKDDGTRFIYGIAGNDTLIDTDGLLNMIKEDSPEAAYKRLAKSISVKEGKKNTTFDNITLVFYTGKVSELKLLAFLHKSSFLEQSQ